VKTEAGVRRACDGGGGRGPRPGGSRRLRSEKGMERAVGSGQGRLAGGNRRDPAAWTDGVTREQRAGRRRGSVRPGERGRGQATMAGRRDVGDGWGRWEGGEKTEIET
jgi:hypothetical protein